MGTDIECDHHQMDSNTSKRKVITNNSSSSVSISAPISISSSATPSSPSPFSVMSSAIPIAPSPNTSTTKYSMEEVWKDICLSSLHPPTKTTATPSAGTLQGILFQEFLSLPHKTHRSSKVPSHSTSHHECPRSSLGGTDSGFFGSQGQPASTILSLNSTPPSSLTLYQDDLHPLDSSTVEFSILPKKRVPENEDSCHRNKRMIKNRESAARSRARKQICVDVPAQFPKKHTLYRTLTAPF